MYRVALLLLVLLSACGQSPTAPLEPATAPTQSTYAVATN